MRERREFASYVFESIGKYFGVDRFVSEVYKIIAETSKSAPNYWGTIESYLYSIRDIVKNCVQPTEALCNLLVFY